MTWFVLIHGALWLIGWCLAELDYEQKIDEGRRIDQGVRRGPAS